MGRKVRPSENVVFTDLDDGTGVLLHLETKFYYSLNESGCFMWQLIEKEQDFSEDKLVEGLYDHFDVDRDTAVSDVKEFIDDLAKEGLIKIIE